MYHDVSLPYGKMERYPEKSFGGIVYWVGPDQEVRRAPLLYTHLAALSRYVDLGYIVFVPRFSWVNDPWIWPFLWLGTTPNTIQPEGIDLLANGVRTPEGYIGDTSFFARGGPSKWGVGFSPWGEGTWPQGMPSQGIFYISKGLPRTRGIHRTKTYARRQPTRQILE